MHFNFKNATQVLPMYTGELSCSQIITTILITKKNLIHISAAKIQQIYVLILKPSKLVQQLLLLLRPFNGLFPGQPG